MFVATQNYWAGGLPPLRFAVTEEMKLRRFDDLDSDDDDDDIRSPRGGSPHGKKPMFLQSPKSRGGKKRRSPAKGQSAMQQLLGGEFMENSLKTIALRKSPSTLAEEHAHLVSEWIGKQNDSDEGDADGGPCDDGVGGSQHHRALTSTASIVYEQQALMHQQWFSEKRSYIRHYVEDFTERLAMLELEQQGPVTEEEKQRLDLLRLRCSDTISEHDEEDEAYEEGDGSTTTTTKIGLSSSPSRRRKVTVAERCQLRRERELQHAQKAVDDRHARLAQRRHQGENCT